VIRDRHHLIEFVTDEDDRAALARDAADRGEEQGDLLGREDGGGFVEDQHAGVTIHHLEDLDPLPFAHRELPDARVRVDAQAVLDRDLLDARRLGPRVQEEPRHVPAQQDVLGHRKCLNQPEVLMDHPDAARDGVAGRAELDGLAVDADHTRIGTVEARQDAHQGGFARAVLAEQGEHLPGADGEVDARVRHDPGERLDDALQFDERPHRYLAVGACPSMPFSSQLKSRISLSVIALPAGTRPLPV